MQFRRFVFLVLGLALLTFAACGPPTPETAAIARATPDLERDACVLLRALDTSGKVDAICATADMLAPLVPTLLATQQEAAAARRVAAPKAAPVLAYSLPLPAKAVEPRRCVAWLTIAGKAHGSNDPDASGP